MLNSLEGGFLGVRCNPRNPADYFIDPQRDASMPS
jgi:hypothetical protein